MSKYRAKYIKLNRVIEDKWHNPQSMEEVDWREFYWEYPAPVSWIVTAYAWSYDGYFQYGIYQRPGERLPDLR